MKNKIKYILILVFFILIILILNFCRSQKHILEDIIIFGLWDEINIKNEYEISVQNTVTIDVFSTFYNKYYKKIAPGSKGYFKIKFIRSNKTNYKIKIDEKTSKPQNLIFFIENERYSTLKEMEKTINEKFLKTDQIIINWEWKYYINQFSDIQDTKDAKEIPKYIFEIQAIIEE